MLVSIIIPCYNVAPYVARALDSALAQTYTDTEIICVDNNSTDETLAILEDYQKKYPTKIQVYKESIQGAPAARNLGLKHAKGEWLQFLDADDEILPDKIEHQLELISEKKEQVVLGSRVYHQLNGKEIFYVPWRDHFKGLAHGLYVGQTSANLWHMDAIESVNYWDESLPNCQDLFLVFSLFVKNVEMVVDSTILTNCYERESGQITKSNPVDMYARSVFLGEQLNQYLESHHEIYWRNNTAFFYTALLRKLKLIAGYNYEEAIRLATIYLPKNFTPLLKSKVGVGLNYWLAYSLLGFKLIIKSKHYLKRLACIPFKKVNK